jgi:hypothetical protein
MKRTRILLLGALVVGLILGATLHRTLIGSGVAQGDTISASGPCPTARAGINPGATCWRTDTKDFSVFDGTQWLVLATITSSTSTVKNLTPHTVTFSQLGTLTTGTIVVCSDCDPAAGATCTSAGAKTGAVAFKLSSGTKCVG